MEGTKQGGTRLPLISARYGRRLMRFLRQHNIDSDDILAGTGLDEDLLDHPDCFITIDQVCKALTQTKRLLDDERAPFEFGRLLDLKGHGLSGFAEHHRRTDPRSLGEMITHYFRVTLPIMGLHFESDSHSVRIRLQDAWELGELREFVVKIYLGSILSLSRQFSDSCAIEFDFPSTLGPDPWRSVTGGAPVRFNSAHNQVVVPLRGLGKTDQVVLRARELITENPGRDSTLERVAHRLGMSPRNLRRHLSLANRSFSDIRNEVRQRFATKYLTETQMPLDTIAERLGYSDQASFSKAYRTWTGQTPGQVRRIGRGDPA